MDEFKASCRSQSEGFKCIKERTKGSVPLLRRGLMTFVATRQRQHRRFCTNLESEHTKRFIQATTCIMEKRLAPMKANDGLLVQNLVEIYRRNYNDSALELKQFCCTFFNFKKNFRELVGDECSNHKPAAEDLLNQIITDDLMLICDDDDKLTKVCPKLEQLVAKPDPNFKLAQGRSPPGMALYLIATLGESTAEPPEA